MLHRRKTNKVQVHTYISFARFTTVNEAVVLMLSSLVVSVLFIILTGSDWAGSRGMGAGGWRGAVAMEGKVSLKRFPAASSQFFYLPVLVGTLDVGN